MSEPLQAPPGEPSRRGVRLAVDVGTVRVGVAISDPDGILATPVATLARDATGATDVTALAGLVEEHNVVEVVVGLPRTLRGADGAAVAAAREYGAALAERIGPVPVVYVDERMTTVTASRVLRDRGISARAGRAVIDQLAAVTILQSRLDALAASRGGR